MNRKVNTRANLTRYLYDNYKEFFLPFGIFVVSLLIFINFTLPQIKNLLDLDAKIKLQNEKLQVMKDNLNKLSAMDSSTLESQRTISSRALPSDKDFAGVLNAVSQAALKSQVILGDYGFEVGDIKKIESDVKYPGFKLTLDLVGGPQEMQRFMEELYKTVPISEVIAVKSSPDSSQVTAIFYYKAEPPVKIRNDVPVKMISKEGSIMLSEISTWTNAQAESALIIPPIPSSGERSKSSPF